MNARTFEPLSATAMRRRATVSLWVALVLIVVLVAGVTFGRGMFSRNSSLYFITDSANGLTPGTAVKLSGFRIGAVSGLQLGPDLSVMVTLKIPSEDFERLRKDAKVTLKQQDMVQPATLEITPGRSAEPLSSETPRIAFDRGRSLGQSAQDLTDRLAPILDDIKVLTATLSDRERGLGPLLESSRAASRDLAATAAQFRALAAETRVRVAAVGTRAEGTLGDASAAFTRDDALPGLLLKIDGTLDDVQAVAKDARAISTAAKESVPQTLRDIQPAVEDAREILSGVKQSWPIKNMLPARPDAKKQ